MDWPIAVVICIAILALAWIITEILAVRDLDSLRNIERRLGRCEVRVNELEEAAEADQHPDSSR